MRSAILAAAIAASGPSLLAATTEIAIQPGPSTISDAEKAIVADPAKDIQHGVILVEETDRNDSVGNMSQISYHLRAKILSNEARRLGDIAIPVERGPNDLKKWWGRTICPDQVQELKDSELKLQLIAKSSAGKDQELRGALPGVAPGCVIDYGYVVQSEYFASSQRVFLQNAWPVRATRFRWVPSRGYPASYVLSRAEGLPIKAVADAKSVLVTAYDLAPVPEEPHMPPMDEARASVVFYYPERNEKPEEFWDLEAKAVDKRLKSFISGQALAEVVASLPVSKDASTDERLRAAYTWVGQNLKNTMLTSAEEDELANDDDDQKAVSNARGVLKAKAGTPRELDYVFAGLARALGAEASLVFAVDRSDRFWNKPLKSMSQFTFTFVAVREPGQHDDNLVFVDAGSGLEYGEVPWRATAANALMCGPKGSTTILVPAPSPKSNRSDTHVALTFSDGNDSMVVKWNRTAGGAGGADYRRWLRNLDTRQRKETLDRICGSSATLEVTAAELPGLDERSAPYEVACELEESDINISENIGSYTYRVMGPWWPETPEFIAATRVQPVLFDYPKIDILAIDIAAPQGFKPKAPPAPVNLQSQYGRYMLEVTATATGFHVDRAFALTALLVKKEEYPALRKFFEDIRSADQAAVTFERIPKTP